MLRFCLFVALVFTRVFCWNTENCTLLIHQKVDGSTYFNRSWEVFKSGFGSKSGNYWFGNELLHQLTKDGLYKLRFDLQALDSEQWYWAEYSGFIVDSEATKYRLTVGGYSGNAGDAMAVHNGMKFTTFDRDNDEADSNCAEKRGGGFWWKKCGNCFVTACMKSFRGYSWETLPETNKELKTSRGWLMCV